MLDIVFVAHNRLAFTQAAFAALLLNTTWQHVDRLYVYDDASEDGTREWFDTAIRSASVETVLRAERAGSPVVVMQHYLAEEDRPHLWAKIDNDVVVPPGWLDVMLLLLRENMEVELLGMEAGQTNSPHDDPPPYRVEGASHVGGIGVFRRSAFTSRPAMSADGRYGFTEWQHAWHPARGWVTPDLPVLQLDRLPFEPWLSLSREYLERGWQRGWPTYPEHLAWAWQWFAPDAQIEREEEQLSIS